MAAVTQDLALGESFSITVTFDDVTGVISRIDWKVSSGTLIITVHRQGQADLTRTATTDGGVNVPAGYAMTKTAKGGWAWLGAISFEMSWHS